MYYNNVLYYFRKNLQGDITGIYNASGNIIAQYEYTPYGAPLTITNGSGTDVSTNATHIANINPFRYRGYYYDTETELYYLITRYYDPEVGRFLNADSLISTGQGILGDNVFVYCLNNPSCRYDPLGLCSVCDSGAYGPCSDLANASNDECSCPECSLFRIALPGSPLNYTGGLKLKGPPNGTSELYKGSELSQKRWYDSEGWPYLDRDYTDHGNSKNHPLVPHDHDWKDDGKGGKKRDENWHEPRENLDDNDDGAAKEVAQGVAIGVVAYGTYLVIKWAVAAACAIPTSGSSLILAGATP